MKIRDIGWVKMIGLILWCSQKENHGQIKKVKLNSRKNIFNYQMLTGNGAKMIGMQKKERILTKTVGSMPPILQNNILRNPEPQTMLEDVNGCDRVRKIQIIIE